MPSDNLIVVATAGSGKTTKAVRLACEDKSKRTALVTYTNNGLEELRSRAYRSYGHIPSHVKVSTWYSFVLKELVRPYRNFLYSERVDTINFERAGQSRRRFSKTDVGFYFSSAHRIWSDRVTDFAVRIIDATGALPLQRLAKIYDRVLIDEAQDLAGWDLELVQAMLATGIEVILVGDNRQTTFTTNQNPKHKKYRGEAIVDLFKKWQKKGLVKLVYSNVSHRCCGEVCNFANSFFPDLPATISSVAATTGHDGVYLVKQCDEKAYYDKFEPQTLQYNRAGPERMGKPLNFGEAKGMTFDRVMIYPHANLKTFLSTGKMALKGESKTKSYVAVTRARHSVGFVVPDDFKSSFCDFYDPDEVR